MIATITEELTPDYTLIRQYASDGAVNEHYFKHNVKYCFGKPGYPIVKKLITNEAGSDANLYFFWVYYFEDAEHCKWARQVELFKIWNTYNKDLTALKSLLKIFRSSYERDFNPNQNIREQFYLHSITFKMLSDKGVPYTRTITAHPLLNDLFDDLDKWVAPKECGRKQEVKNKATYFKNFVLGTIPLFNYLKDYHFKEASNNKVYDFIGRFIETFGIDWENITAMTPQAYIKDVYKGARERKAETGENHALK